MNLKIGPVAYLVPISLLSQSPSLMSHERSRVGDGVAVGLGVTVGFGVLVGVKVGVGVNVFVGVGVMVGPNTCPGPQAVSTMQKIRTMVIFLMLDFPNTTDGLDAQNLRSSNFTLFHFE